MRSSHDFAELFRASPAKLAVGTMDGELVEVNRAYAELFGYSRDEMLGKSIAELGLIPEPELRRLLGLGEGPGVAMREVQVAMRTRAGRVLDVLMSADIVAFGGELRRVATLVDVTERGQAEEQRGKLHEQLLRAQNLESLGRLAGGITETFDDMLAGIAGSASFLLEGLADDDARRQEAARILDLAGRGADVIEQLCAFAQRQPLQPRLVDLNVCVAKVAALVDGMIGEEVSVTTRLVSRPCWVNVDQARLERVLVAVALNAREAMPRGGALSYETRIEVPDALFAARHPHLRLGPVVRLAVTDTGAGMPDGVKTRAFEPFFTTHGGRGLGLAVACGIVRHGGGVLELDSSPGRGTTVRIYLPAAAVSA